MKTYYPTEKEFANPISYIDSIMASPIAQAIGCIKIVPPKGFKPGLAYDTSSKKPLPTRYQVLQELCQGKSFKQNATGHTF